MRNDKDRAHMEITPTTLLPGSPVVCLVCDRTIRDPHGRDIHNLFLESSVTSHSHQPLATILADVLRAPLNANEVYSKTLCVRCMKLVDELDDLQCRADAIKTSLFSRYNRSFIKRLKLPGPDAALGGGIGLENEDEEVEIEVDDRLVARLCVKKEEEPECDDDDDDDDTLRPEDQGILPDDPEFNPARDDSAWLGVRARTRGRPRGRGRGRGRGRPRGRGRGRGRGPGRPPKIPRDSERATTSSESLGEKLGALVTKILGEDEDEHTGEEKKVKLGSAEGEGESKGDEESLDATATSPKIMGGEERCEEVVVNSALKGRERSITMGLPPDTEPMEVMKKSVNVVSKAGKLDTKVDKGTATGEKSLLVFSGEPVSKSAKDSHKNRVHLCNVCDVEFEYVQEFREHLKMHGNYECAVCGKVVSKQGMLTQHYVKFHGLKVNGGSQHICWVCGKVYKSKQAVSYHILTSHSKTKLKCDVCDKCFGHPKNLKAHQKRHGERDIACDKCPARFYTTSELGYHYNAKHRNAQCWKCEQCGRKFSRSTSYINHVEKHRPKRFECTTCLKMFRRKAHIEAHMKQHTAAVSSNSESGCQSPGSSRIKEYLRCSKCSILFDSEEMKKDHLCSDHMRLIKQFFCNGCNVSFDSREDLDSHPCPQRSSSEAETQSQTLTEEDVQLYTEPENLTTEAIAINTEEWDTCFVVLG